MSWYQNEGGEILEKTGSHTHKRAGEVSRESIGSGRFDTERIWVSENETAALTALLSI